MLPTSVARPQAYRPCNSPCVSLPLVGPAPSRCCSRPAGGLFPQSLSHAHRRPAGRSLRRHRHRYPAIHRRHLGVVAGVPELHVQPGLLRAEPRQDLRRQSDDRQPVDGDLRTGVRRIRPRLPGACAPRSPTAPRRWVSTAPIRPRRSNSSCPSPSSAPGRARRPAAISPIPTRSSRRSTTPGVS